MEKESSIKQLISSSLEQVRTIIDADTVVGKQMVTPSGTVIIPISKVSMGFASGGLDLPTEEKDEVKNFGGGGGTGVTVTPIGFLTVYTAVTAKAAIAAKGAEKGLLQSIFGKMPVVEIQKAQTQQAVAVGL